MTGRIVRVAWSAHASRRLLRLLAAGTLCALVVPACSGSASKASAPDSVDKTATSARPEAGRDQRPDHIDPCGLLTIKQIRAATGWNLETGRRDAKAPKSAGAVCNWERADGEAGVHLQFHAAGGSVLLGQRRRSLAGRGPMRVPHAVSIKGASDAFDIAAEGLLAIRVGDHYIQISVIGGTAGIDDHLQLGADAAAALTGSDHGGN
jgi:Protein of unknown function (DUF3558)